MQLGGARSGGSCYLPPTAQSRALQLVFSGTHLSANQKHRSASSSSWGLNPGPFPVDRNTAHSQTQPLAPYTIKKPIHCQNLSLIPPHHFYCTGQCWVRLQLCSERCFAFSKAVLIPSSRDKVGREKSLKSVTPLPTLSSFWVKQLYITWQVKAESFDQEHLYVKIKACCYTGSKT